MGGTGYERDESGSYLDDVGPITLALRDLTRAQDELLRAQARRLGVNTTDMTALRLLEVHGPLGATELARRLDLRPASVTTLVDRLEDAGHLERVREADDRRRVTVRARPESLERSWDIWAPVVRAMDDVGRGLSDDEQARVARTLHRVAAVMRAHTTTEA